MRQCSPTWIDPPMLPMNLFASYVSGDTHSVGMPLVSYEMPARSVVLFFGKIPFVSYSPPKRNEFASWKLRGSVIGATPNGLGKPVMLYSLMLSERMSMESCRLQNSRT